MSIERKEREAAGYRFARMTWRIFGDEALLTAARDIFLKTGEMDDELTTLENQAVAEAAEIAGKYLVDIGKTDFALMDEEERAEFLRLLILGYRRALRRLVSEHPPY